jgi:hypothetical protein
LSVAGRGQLPDEPLTSAVMALVGLTAWVFFLATAAACGLTWLDEPFADWEHYASRTRESWFWCAMHLAWSLSLAAVLAFAYKPVRAATFLRASSRLWLWSPLTLGWSACAWLAGSHDWTFTFTGGWGGNADYLPEWTKFPLTILGSGWAFLILLAGLFVSVIRGYRGRMAKIYPANDGSCDSCGYSLEGLNRRICPECGNEQSARNGQRAVFQDGRSAVPPDQ